MKRIYVGTIHRKAPAGQWLGKFYIVDWDTKEIISMESDKVRGMCFHNGRLVVSLGKECPPHKVEYDRLVEFNRHTLEFLEAIDYPTVEHVHKIYSKNGELILTSTGNDSYFKVKEHTDGKTYSRVILGNPRADTLHFNSMAWAPNGEEYHVYNGRRLVYNYSKKRVIFNDLSCPHDIEFVDNHRFIVNDSKGFKSLLVDSRTGKIEKVLLQTKGKTTSHPAADPKVAQWGFVRGLAINKKDNLTFIGSSPGYLHCFNMNSWQLESVLTLSEHPCETIFDICLDIDDWGLNEY